MPLKGMKTPSLSQESLNPAHPHQVTQGLWERGRDLLCNLQAVKQGDRERHRPGRPGASVVCVVEGGGRAWEYGSG